MAFDCSKLLFFQDLSQNLCFVAGKVEIEKMYFYFFQISGRFLPYLASCCLEADMALVARVLCLPDPQVHLENLFF